MKNYPMEATLSKAVPFLSEGFKPPQRAGRAPDELSKELSPLFGKCVYKSVLFEEVFAYTPTLFKETFLCGVACDYYKSYGTDHHFLFPKAYNPFIGTPARGWCPTLSYPFNRLLRQLNSNGWLRFGERTPSGWPFFA